MKKKIGVFLEAIPFGGGMFQYNQTIIDAVYTLPAEKYDTVFAYKSNIWEDYLSSYSVNKVKVPESFTGKVSKKIWFMLGLSFSAWRKISKYFLPEIRTLIAQKADLWIFPTQDALTFQSDQIQALATVHDLMHKYEASFPEVSDSKEKKYREYIFSNISQYARAVLVDSEFGKYQLQESYPTNTEHIYSLPYIAPRYIYESEISADFEKKYSLPKKFIFYPAQFWMHKNHLRLVNAIALLKDKLPDINLVLVGSKKNSFNKVVEEVRKLNIEENVLFMGYVPNEDIPEFYRRACALIMPTFFGPTNIPPLEAFVLGCPVGVSNIYGIPEQVGDAALLFDPKSVESIANTISQLWSDNDLRNSLIEKGRLKSANWGQKQFSERLTKIIGSIFKEHSVT